MANSIFFADERFGTLTHSVRRSGDFGLTKIEHRHLSRERR
jgi:hypothetical protein